MNREKLQLVGEAMLFGVVTIGLGVLMCTFIDVSIKWSPLLGPLAMYGLLKAAQKL